MKEIYHAVDEQAALDALERFEQRWDERYPAIGALWRDAWDRFVPMLDFPPEIRKVLYTTNMVESLIIWSPGTGVVDVADEAA